MYKKVLAYFLSFAITLSLFTMTPIRVNADVPIAPIIEEKASGNNYHALYANGLPLLIEEGTTSGYSNVKYDSNGDGVYDTMFEEDINLLDYDIFGGSPDTGCEAADIKMTGGKVHYILGGGHKSGNIDGDIKIEVSGGYIAEISSGCYTNTGNSAHVAGDAEIIISGGEIGGIYGGGWAWGSSSCSLMENSTVNITGGTINNVAGGWVGSGGTSDITDSFTINISGGTIKGNVSVSDYVSEDADKAINITGGTIHGTIGGATPTNGIDPVYKTALCFMDEEEAKKNTSVSTLATNPDCGYGMTDVLTDGNGKIFVYLPEGTLTTAGVIDGDNYINTEGITTLSNNMAGGDLVFAPDSPELIGGAIYRSSVTEGTIKFVSDTSGTYYYLVTDNNNPVSINTSGNGELLQAGIPVRLDFTNFTAGPQYVHIVEKSDAGKESEVLTMAMPYDYYYSEDFEIYPLGAYISSGDLFPISQQNNGTGNENQKIIDAINNQSEKMLSLSSASNWASDQFIQLDSNKLAAAGKYVFEGDVYPLSTDGWQLRFSFANGQYNSDKTGGGNETGIYLKNGKVQAHHGGGNIIEIGDYLANQWHRFKIEVMPYQNKFAIYLNDELLADSLTTITGIDRLAISAAHGKTVYFDNLLFYAESAIAPILQRASTSTDGTKVILGFDKEIADPQDKHGEFTVMVDDNLNVVTAVALGADDTKTIELELATAIEFGQEVKVSYSEGTVTSSDGGLLASFTDIQVENNVPEPIYTVNVDSLSGGTIEPSEVSATAGTTINLTITPDTGKRLKGGTLKYNDGTKDTFIDETTKSFEMPAADITITAEFEDIPEATYTITMGSLSGGSIEPSEASATAGTIINLTITPDTGKRLKGGTLKYNDGTKDTSIDETTKSFGMPATNVIVTAEFENVPSSSGGSRRSGADESAPLDTGTEVTVITTDGKVSVIGTLTGTEGAVRAVIKNDDFNKIDIADKSAIVNVQLATVTFDEKAIDAIGAVAGSGDVILTVRQISISELSAVQREQVGTRPVYNFTVTGDNKTISDFNGGYAMISIPYTLKAGENPCAIVIWYLSDSGKLVGMRGHYDAGTKSVIFRTPHFSGFVIGYNFVDFKDVPEDAWYESAVTFLAARSITTGTGDGKFSPDAALTRGQFIVMLMRAYGIEPDANSADNFADAGNIYYTNYLAAAKRLGISAGIGNNLFAPDKEITRQEMFTLLYNTLMVIGEIPEGNSGKRLSDFDDAAGISPWAKEAMTLLVETGTVSGSDGKLFPTNSTTRAEMAQVLYNLLIE